MVPWDLFLRAEYLSALSVHVASIEMCCAHRLIENALKLVLVIVLVIALRLVEVSALQFLPLHFDTFRDRTYDLLKCRFHRHVWLC